MHVKQAARNENGRVPWCRGVIVASGGVCFGLRFVKEGRFLALIGKFTAMSIAMTRCVKRVESRLHDQRNGKKTTRRARRPEF